MTMPDAPTLMPCPFCGCEMDVYLDGPGAYELHHPSMSAEKCVLLKLSDRPFAYAETREALGYSWNQRSPSPLRELLAFGCLTGDCHHDAQELCNLAAFRFIRELADREVKGE